MNNVVNQVAFLRTTREFPAELHQLTIEVDKSYVDTANAVNNRIIGIFPTNRPAITGESWYLNNQRQQSLRQVYQFGAIAPGAELDIPVNISNFTIFTKIYGTVITASGDYRPLPYAVPLALTAQIAILVGPIAGVNQIRIINGATAPAITSGIAILEWLSNV